VDWLCFQLIENCSSEPPGAEESYLSSSPPYFLLESSCIGGKSATLQSLDLLSSVFLFSCLIRTFVGGPCQPPEKKTGCSTARRCQLKVWIDSWLCWRNLRCTLRLQALCRALWQGGTFEVHQSYCGGMHTLAAVIHNIEIMALNRCLVANSMACGVGNDWWIGVCLEIVAVKDSNHIQTADQIDWYTTQAECHVSRSLQTVIWWSQIGIKILLWAIRPSGGAISAVFSGDPFIDLDWKQDGAIWK